MGEGSVGEAMATAKTQEAEGLCGAQLESASGEPEEFAGGNGTEAGGDQGGPPEEAKLQDDGSYVQVCADGYSLRWTQRADGTWRKPEKMRASPGSPGRIAAGLISKHVEAEA